MTVKIQAKKWNMVNQPGFKNIYNAEVSLWETEHTDNGQTI